MHTYNLLYLLYHESHVPQYCSTVVRKLMSVSVSQGTDSGINKFDLDAEWVAGQ